VTATGMKDGIAELLARLAPAFGHDVELWRSRRLDLDAWRTLYTAARRALGHASLTAAEIEVLAGLGVDWCLRRDQLGRAVLLRALEPRCALGELVPVVHACYRGGDNEERIAVLRALPLLRAAPHFASLATDACRTSVLAVFTAIACDNPFPERHFDDRAFHQMTLKALFVGARLSQVRGLARRNDSELGRMGRAYAAELRAAGRPVPLDLALLGDSR
jgi:hypothetical protein